MKTHTPATLVSLLTVSLLMVGCGNAAFVGNLFVLSVTFAIFFGTLQLGRTSEAVRSRGADASASVSPTAQAAQAANTTTPADGARSSVRSHNG